MDYGFDFSFLGDFWPSLLDGLWVSIRMAAVSLGGGFILGVLLAVARGQESGLIRRLAGQTGGGHFILGRNDDVNATFTAVMQELHYQYTLGFTPERADGRVHEIVVRALRPGLTVRARRTYLAAGPAATTRPR